MNNIINRMAIIFPFILITLSCNSAALNQMNSSNLQQQIIFTNPEGEEITVVSPAAEEYIWPVSTLSQSVLNALSESLNNDIFTVVFTKQAELEGVVEIPESINLKFQGEGALLFDSEDFLIINSQISADSRQIFKGEFLKLKEGSKYHESKITGIKNKSIPVEWFGAIDDENNAGGLASKEINTNAWIAACFLEGKNITTEKKTYYINRQINLYPGNSVDFSFSTIYIHLDSPYYILNNINTGHHSGFRMGSNTKASNGNIVMQDTTVSFMIGKYNRDITVSDQTSSPDFFTGVTNIEIDNMNVVAIPVDGPQKAPFIDFTNLSSNLRFTNITADGRNNPFSVIRNEQTFLEDGKSVNADNVYISNVKAKNLAFHREEAVIATIRASNTVIENIYSENCAQTITFSNTPPSMSDDKSIPGGNIEINNVTAVKVNFSRNNNHGPRSVIWAMGGGSNDTTLTDNVSVSNVIMNNIFIKGEDRTKEYAGIRVGYADQIWLTYLYGSNIIINNADISECSEGIVVNGIRTEINNSGIYNNYNNGILPGFFTTINNSLIYGNNKGAHGIDIIDKGNGIFINYDENVIINNCQFGLNNDPYAHKNHITVLGSSRQINIKNSLFKAKSGFDLYKSDLSQLILLENNRSTSTFSTN